MNALPGKVTMRCADCERPMVHRTTRMIHRGVVRQSNARGQRHRCQGCAWEHGWAQAPPAPPLPPPPRYCTCYGDVPPPNSNGMCPDCFRLVEAMAVA
jgi:hypothetical protein